MSTATDLISQPAATPPYDIVRAAYAELQVTDIAASEHFYADLLGMIVTERAADAVYLRGWEERVHHSLVLRHAPVPAAARLGFRMRGERDLDLLAGDLEAQRLAVSWADAPDPGVGRVLRVRDPFGYPLEFVHEMQQLDTQLQRFDLHRGPPILRGTPPRARAFLPPVGFDCQGVKANLSVEFALCATSTESEGSLGCPPGWGPASAPTWLTYSGASFG